MDQDTMFSNYKDVVGMNELRIMLGKNGKRLGKHLAYNLLQTGQIKSKKIGREYAIQKTAIIKYLQQ